MKERPRVLVVGVGLIGGSLGLALRRSGAASSVAGVSRPETLAEAIRLGSIERGYEYEHVAEAVAEADLVILATPIRRILDLLAVLGRCDLPAGLVVSDVGSTKGEIVREAARLLPAGVCFVGGHPMAGSEKSGVAAADPFLFQNAIYVLCPAPNVDAGVTEGLGGLFESLGSRVIIMDAELHDRAVAAVSHLPQFLAVALVNFAARGSDHALKLAAGGFRDMTRIASSPFTMWRDVVETNTPCIRETLRRFAGDLADLADRLEPGHLEAAFTAAAHTRSGIPRDTKGFLRPLAELLVVVEDRPGIIASIAAPLAEHGINIRDIEVLKVREGEGGTLRLAFEDRTVSERARRILTSLGLSVRHRSP
jgi:prephenate dehydrogenase